MPHHFPPLAINVLGGMSLSPAEHIRLIARVGFDGFFTDWHPERTSAFAAAAAEYGLLYSSIHAPFMGARRLWELEGTPEAAAAAAEEVDTLLSCLRDCAAHGVPVMVMHAFIGTEEHTVTEAGLRHIARILDEADALGIRVAFENIEGEEYLAAIMEAFWDRPSLGFCFDTGHELCYNGARDMLGLYGERLVYTHFNDNLGQTQPAITWHDDLHLVMGDGIVDFAGVMARIEKTPYRGILACEMTLSNKPGKHTHDGYARMGLEDFYRLCLARMRWATGQGDLPPAPGEVHP